MRIISLKLKNYRNYDELNIDFNKSQNIIIGNNAQGKTNILESIYYLAITKSFLCNDDNNVIKKDCLNCSITGDIESVDHKRKLSVILDNSKILKINKKIVKKHSDYLGNLKVIVFTPDNVRLLKDSPSYRRKFFNIELCQLYKKYVIVLNNYNALLKQRNDYLKIIKTSNNRNEIYINVINDKFSDYIVTILKYRKNFIDMINKYIEEVYFNISGFHGLRIEYKPSIEYKDDYLYNYVYNKICDNFERDIQYGCSLIGSHKDDFEFYLDNLELSSYGSQGQIKMAILALRISEIFVFKDICGETPVLLLDDVFSELDIDKRNNLIKYLNFDVQSIVTTTDLNDINCDYINNACIYKVDDGKVVLYNYEGEVGK